VLHLRTGFGADISAWASVQPNVLDVLYLHWNLGSGGDVLGQQVRRGAQWFLLGVFSRRSFLLHGAHLRQNTGTGLKSDIIFDVFAIDFGLLKVRRTSNLLAKMVHGEVHRHAKQQAKNRK
jgi:hypothetical protein